MALLDRLFGRNITLDPPTSQTTDEQAVERYEYLLRNAKPDTIEKAHVDAFEQLTPEQRDLVFERFTAELPATVRPADATSTTLARSATRAEAREPGLITRTLGDDRPGVDSRRRREDGPLAGSFLNTFATYAIASTAIDAIFWAGLIGTTVIASDAAGDSGPSDSSPADGGSADAGSGFLGLFEF